jgi:hypothetical protein
MCCFHFVAIALLELTDHHLKLLAPSSFWIVVNHSLLADALLVHHCIVETQVQPDYSCRAGWPPNSGGGS